MNDLAPFDNRIPVYATKRPRLMLLGEDAVFLFLMLGGLLMKATPLGGIGVLLAWPIAWRFQVYIDKKGLPPGVILYAASCWVLHPWVLKRAPWLYKAASFGWRTKGCMPPPHPNHSYTR